MLEDIIESSKKASRFTEDINREKLWVNYQKQTSSNEFANKWNDFCHKIRVPMMPLFYQHITDEVFEFLLKEEFELNKPTAIEDQTMPFNI